MEAIGKRRSRAFATSFVIFWALGFPVAILGLELGFLPAFFGSGTLAGVLGKWWVKNRREAIVRSEMQAQGIPPDAFDPTPFIID